MDKNKLINIIFYVFLFGFMTLYLSSLTGYFEYENHKKTTLTQEQIYKYEEDIKNGKEIDLNEYIQTEIDYSNKLSKLASNMSNIISQITKTSISKTFKYLSKLIEE